MKINTILDQIDLGAMALPELYIVKYDAYDT